MLYFYDLIGKLDYVFISATALWGLYCAILVISRVGTKRFKTEADQEEFLEAIEPDLSDGNFEAVQAYCEGNEKALPTMVQLAILNRDLGYAKVRQFVMERFQRDVLADLDNRVAWIATCIKTAPMLGLFGTVCLVCWARSVTWKPPPIRIRKPWLVTFAWLSNTRPWVCSWRSR